MRALVLLVDDEVDQVEMYRLGLEAAAFRVIAAHTGADAVVRARDHQPHAIVLDLRLPDMTGWEVCSLLKNDPQTERIPIVILTAAVEPSLAEQAAAAGCVTHLLKPCFPDDLSRTLREILALHPQA